MTEAGLGVAATWFASVDAFSFASTRAYPLAHAPASCACQPSPHRVRKATVEQAIVFQSPASAANTQAAGCDGQPQVTPGPPRATPTPPPVPPAPAGAVHPESRSAGVPRRS